MADRYLDFYQLAKELDVRRRRILDWCNVGLTPAREPNAQERALVVYKRNRNRVYLKRVKFGRSDPRTRMEWVNAFLNVVTPE